MPSDLRRVVITGLGVISPNGMGVEETWNHLLQGISGIRPIRLFDASLLPVRIAGEITDWDASRFFDTKELARLDRAAQFGIVASDEAMRNARMGKGLAGSLDPHRSGCVLSSGIGGIWTFEEQMRNYLEKGHRRVSPFMIPRLIVNVIPGIISIRHDLRGPNFALVSACATGAHSIGEGFRMIRHGYADVMVTGGCEAAISPITVAGFNNMKALSNRNDLMGAASSPFDKDRDGFVISEGAACLVLEELAHARGRDATILAEVVGYGATGDAHHITMPREGGDGLVRALRLALDDAGIQPRDIGYINAHGTSTPTNDAFETKALKTVFGEHARSIPISSTKSMVGHLLGGAGAIGALACVKTLQEGKVHPTTNLKTPDPECDLDYVSGGVRNVVLQYAVQNSMGFGGQNASLVFRRFEG